MSRLLAQMVQRENFDRTFDWDAQLEAKIKALTPDQVNGAFRKHVDPQAVLIVKAGDFKAAGVISRRRYRVQSRASHRTGFGSLACIFANS